MRCGNEDGGCKKGGGRLLPKGRQECDYCKVAAQQVGVAALVASTSRCRVLMAGEAEVVETAQSNASSQACHKWLGAVPRGAAGEAGAVANPIDRERTVATQQALTLFRLVTLYRGRILCKRCLGPAN